MFQDVSCNMKNLKFYFFNTTYLAVSHVVSCHRVLGDNGHVHPSVLVHHVGEHGAHLILLLRVELDDLVSSALDLL